jgi:hypothetical protein
MTGNKNKKLMGKQEGKTKMLLMKNSKERLCLLGALMGTLCPGIQASGETSS